jgi:hypothetical protein
MLAMADKNGEVAATVPGLARMANVTIDECETALTAFLSPDPHSRTPDEDGRRIEAIDGGWALINHAKYRAMASRDEQKSAAALRQQRYRQRNARNGSSVTRNENVTPSNATVTQTLHIAEAEAEAEADALHLMTLGKPDCAEESAPTSEKKPKRQAKPEPDEKTWLAGLMADPTYAGIDVTREHGKMVNWCQTNGKQATRRRFVNWLNRCDKPISGTAAKPQWQPDRNADPDAW